MAQNNQEKARLSILLLAPAGSIFFAIASLVLGDSQLQGMFVAASGFIGTIALVPAFIMLRMQLQKSALSMTNIWAFGIAYLLSWMFFMGACSAAIE